jgi:hypothetical protein
MKIRAAYSMLPAGSVGVVARSLLLPAVISPLSTFPLSRFLVLGQPKPLHP